LEPLNSLLEDEIKLIALCQEGDKIAFERLYRRYVKDVYTMAFHMVHSETMAEEVTQEVFISVFKDIQKFQFQSAFTTWLYRIVYRRAADQFRKNRKHREHTISLTNSERQAVVNELRDTEANPFEKAVEREKAQMLENTIASLSPKQRAIMILRYINNRSYEEIAQILRCRIGTVKPRLNRAHKTMLEKLDQLGMK